MKNITIALSGLSLFISNLAFGQTYLWEQILEGEINHQEYCEAFSGGYPNFGNPTLYDLDGDGDKDIYLGLGEKIGCIRNDGSPFEPCWVLEKDPFPNVIIDAGNASPFFIDINNDSLPDLLSGDGTGGGGGGKVQVYLNSSQGSDISFETIPFQIPGIDAHDKSHPTAYDIDKDGDIDLVVGGGSGMVVYCQRISDLEWSPQDTLLYATWQGNAHPSLGDLDGDSIPELIVTRGGSGGKVKLFKNASPISGNVDWELITNDYLSSVGTFYDPILIDYDSDGDQDLIQIHGNFQILEIALNIGSVDTAIWNTKIDTLHFTLDLRGGSLGIGIGIVDIDTNGIQELILGSHLSNVQIYQIENAPSNIELSLIGALQGIVNVESGSLGGISSMSLYDLNEDGLKDLIISTLIGLYYFKNISTTNNYQFIYVQDSVLENIDYSGANITTVGDLDNDKLPDLLVGWAGHGLVRFELINGKWELITEDFYPNVGSVEPEISDFNYDGRQDILMGHAPMLVNISDDLTTPDYVSQFTFNGIADYAGKPIFGNIDGICGKDIIVSGFEGGIKIWGYRGVKPKIKDLSSYTFNTCDSLIIFEALPDDEFGMWEGEANPNGTFNPSSAGIGDYKIVYTYTDGLGCFTNSDTIHINVVACVDGISELEFINSVNIFPNPVANSDIKIVFATWIEDDLTISVFDLHGNKVKAFNTSLKNPNNNILDLDMSDLPSGVYILSFMTDNHFMAKKLVKQK